MTAPIAPKHLSASSRAVWRAVVSVYSMDVVRLAVLAAALESRDRAAEARLAVAKDGPYVSGRWGPRAHPGLAIERDARAAMVRAFRELGLEELP